MTAEVKPTPSKGIVTAAFGSRKYLEMAVDLALSLREVSQLPLSIVSTPSGSRFFERYYAGEFDQVIEVPSLELEEGKGRYLAAKLECLRRSPYDESIFLDADMVCVKEPSFLFDGLRSNRVRVHGRLHDRETCDGISHHGILIRDLIDRLGLDGYTYCSLAVFAFERLAGEALASLMERERRRWDRRTSEHFGKILNDEILLGVLGHHSGVDFFRNPARSYQPLDIGFRWGGNFSFLHPGPMRNREAARILYGIARRRSRARYPLVPSLYWLSDILNRRAEQTGKSRRQAKALDRAIRRVLREAAVNRV
jgi:hypothetical protein